MKKPLTILLFCALIPAGVARADDDDCFVPMAEWQPREAVVAMAAEKGWSIGKLRIDDGCYKIRGTDATGRPMVVELNPATLEVLELDYTDTPEARARDDDHEHEELRERWKKLLGHLPGAEEHDDDH